MSKNFLLFLSKISFLQLNSLSILEWKMPSKLTFETSKLHPIIPLLFEIFLVENIQITIVKFAPKVTKNYQNKFLIFQMNIKDYMTHAIMNFLIFPMFYKLLWPSYATFMSKRSWSKKSSIFFHNWIEVNIGFSLSKNPLCTSTCISLVLCGRRGIITVMNTLALPSLCCPPTYLGNKTIIQYRDNDIKGKKEVSKLIITNYSVGETHFSWKYFIIVKTLGKS